MTNDIKYFSVNLTAEFIVTVAFTSESSLTTSEQTTFAGKYFLVYGLDS